MKKLDPIEFKNKYKYALQNKKNLENFVGILIRVFYEKVSTRPTPYDYWSISAYELDDLLTNYFNDDAIELFPYSDKQEIVRLIRDRIESNQYDLEFENGAIAIVPRILNSYSTADFDDHVKENRQLFTDDVLERIVKYVEPKIARTIRANESSKSTSWDVYDTTFIQLRNVRDQRGSFESNLEEKTFFEIISKRNPNYEITKLTHQCGFKVKRKENTIDKLLNDEQ